MRGVCVRGLEPRPKDKALEKLAQRHKNEQREHGVQQGVPRRPFALLQTALLSRRPIRARLDYGDQVALSEVSHIQHPSRSHEQLLRHDAEPLLHERPELVEVAALRQRDEHAGPAGRLDGDPHCHVGAACPAALRARTPDLSFLPTAPAQRRFADEKIAGAKGCLRCSLPNQAKRPRHMLARRAGRISSIPSRALSTAVHRGAQDFHELRERSLLRYTLKASTEGDALSVIEAMDALCAWLRMEPARRGALTPRPCH